MVYFYLQALIMGALQRVSDDWIVGMYGALRPKTCAVLSKEHINMPQTGVCKLVQQISSTIITFVPTLINSLLMSLLPFFIDWTIGILAFPT